MTTFLGPLYATTENTIAPVSATVAENERVIVTLLKESISDADSDDH